MTKGDKPTTIKTTPHIKGSTSKYNKSSPRNSSKKTYLVVLPENKEGKWFAAESDATIYIKSLCGSPYESKNMLIFGVLRPWLEGTMKKWDWKIVSFCMI